MVAVYLSPLYILANAYVLRWFILWLSACSPVFKKWKVRIPIIVIYSFFALNIVMGTFLPVGMWKRTTKLISNYWLGIMLYVMMIIIIADILRLILKHIKKINQEKLRSRKTFIIVGTVCMALIIIVNVYGMVNARIIRNTPYNITVNKDGGKNSSLKVVLVADLHIGYNIGSSQIEKMVTKINNQNADLVVIAGDIFDNEYEAIDNPERITSALSKIKSRYGTYACYGNHDIQEKILAGFTFASDKKKMSNLKMDKILSDANIKLMMDQGILIDNSFYLYGRPDFERLGRGITKRKTGAEITSNMDKTKPIIVIDHEPREQSELAKAGVDVFLNGHTHDGQLFPANITTYLMWDNSYGYKKYGSLHNIVTSGVGLFGPYMRVGTIAEICTIDIQFKK